MTIQSDPFFRNIDLFRNLGTTVLSGTKVFATWQLESIQASITRSGQQLRAAWADAGSMQEPAKWPDTVQSQMRNAIKMNRDYLTAMTDYQMESMRLLHDMGSEIQQLVTSAMNEQLVNIDVLASREKRKATAVSAQPVTA